MMLPPKGTARDAQAAIAAAAVFLIAAFVRFAGDLQAGLGRFSIGMALTAFRR